MGSAKSKRIEHPDHLQRRIVVRVCRSIPSGPAARGADARSWCIVTDLLDVPAEVIVLLLPLSLADRALLPLAEVRARPAGIW